jgi:hypothetical protein
MSSTKDEKDINNRREFFQRVTGLTGLAMVAALSQMGVPVVNAAQGGEVKPKPDTVGGASGAAKPAPSGQAKQAVSPFFKDPPPWPTGTDTHEYDHLFSTKLRENSWVPDIVPGPQAYFRGDSDLPGAKINMGWQIFTKPYKLEMESHHHDHDEYQFFLGATFPDLVGSFDAEIETFTGREYERHIITKATVLYLPAGLEHNPCDIRRVGKPLFFSSCELSPFFNGIYQTMGYMEMRSSRKID